MEAPTEPINIDLARTQHNAYVALLRELVPTVIELDAEESLPDCPFIEDTVVVTHSGAAVVARPGAPERLGEVKAVAAVLRRLASEGGPNGSSRGSGDIDGKRPIIKSIHEIIQPGVLDGGDVLQVAGHLLVGLSARTNAAAVDHMRAALSAVRDSTAVVALPVPHGLHLKSACSAVDSETLLLADNAAGHAVEAALRERAPALAEGLRMVYVCDALASNVLRIGGAVVAQGSETALGALRTLCDERGLVLRTLPRLTEFEKADGALTCLSVLLP